MNVLNFANEYFFKPLGIAAISNAGCESKEDQFEPNLNKKIYIAIMEIRFSVMAILYQKGKR